MSLNWREIDAVLSELPLAGSQIQKIRQPDFSSLVLELYNQRQRFALYISLAQNATRLHRLTRKTENSVALQRFAQLLRSRLKNARIESAGQIGEERIIKIEISRAGVDLVLWIRLWNNAANIILAEPDGRIIDAFYRRPGRGEVSGGCFSPDTAARAGAGKKQKKEYTVRELPGKGDFNSKIEEYYANTQTAGEVDKLKTRLERLLIQAESRLRTSIEKIAPRIGNKDEIEKTRQTGDLILSNLHTIGHGQRWLTVDNYFNEEETVSIELDPALSPEKNAERYYTKARKEKKRLDLAIEELKSLESELSVISKKLASLEDENDPKTLKRMLHGLKDGGGPVVDQDAERIPGLVFTSGPFRIHVGRTAQENDKLLRNYTKGNDYWLHSRDTPGAYVFIKSIKGKSVPLEVLLDAGNLALHFSKAKSAGKCDLYYTQVKYLRRPKDGKLGLVLPTQEKNLSVRMDEKRLNRLLSR